MDLILLTFKTQAHMESMLFSVEPMGREMNYQNLVGMHKDLADGTLDAIIGSDFTASSYEEDWLTIQRW